MKELYISDNYLIINITSDILVFSKSLCNYDETLDSFRVEEPTPGRGYTIPFDRVSEYVNPKNGEVYTVETLRKFLRRELNRAATSDYMLEVRLSERVDKSIFTVLGRSITLTTDNPPQDVWMKGDLYTGRIASAEILKIVSTDINDVLGGTGAQKVTIVGLDNSGLEISEEVSLNGTTEVVTQQAFKRVNLFYVTLSGSNLTNLGDISIYPTSDALKIMSFIKADFSYAQTAHWTVPSDETWYMIGVEGLLYDKSPQSNRATMQFVELNPMTNTRSRYLDFPVSTDGPATSLDVSDRFVLASNTDWWIQISEVAANGARASFNGIFLRVKN